MILRRFSGGGRLPAAAVMLGAVAVLSLGLGGRNLARAEKEWNQVILVYTTDCKGQIDPCG